MLKKSGLEHGHTSWKKYSLKNAYGKQFLKHTAIGFYLIIAGWIAAAAGYFTSR